MNRYPDLRQLRRSLLIVLLVLTLFPFSALAVTENTLETAADISLPENTAEEKPAITVRPKAILPSFWKSSVKGSSSDLQHYSPWLTESEEQRARELMSELNAGKVSVSDYTAEEQPAGFKVSVYPLDPADFDGETFFVTLPCRELTDAELVALVSGFETLGIPFNPDSLNERNCRRFYDEGKSRDLTSDEAEQMEELERMVIYGILDPEDIKPESECRVIYTLYGPFFLYPYRQMTVNELAAFALKKESVWENDPDLVQKTASKFASRFVRFPSFLEKWSMERTLIPYTDETEGYRILFDVYAPEGQPQAEDNSPWRVDVLLRKNPDGTLLESRLTVEYNNDKPSIHTRRLVSEDEILAAAQSWIKDNILQSGSMDLTDWTIVNNEGTRYQVCAVTSDNLWYVYAWISNTGAVDQFSLSRDPIK